VISCFIAAFIEIYRLNSDSKFREIKTSVVYYYCVAHSDLPQGHSSRKSQLQMESKELRSLVC